MNAEILHQYGIDYTTGVKRFLGDRELYETVLTAFLKDGVLQKIEKAYESNDRKTFFDCVHELKGSSGNADMSKLYRACCELVELLRNDTGTKEEISHSYERFKSVYVQTQEGIRKALEGE